ncbi:discoidin domain-containing protein [Pendulispora brunnea]|uniref:Discoidin domain-containing protein n=1 Tax=Pendulispora brunnea TaxID=2905690 RepID=A0ABZ2KBP3_9BACT
MGQETRPDHRRTVGRALVALGVLTLALESGACSSDERTNGEAVADDDIGKTASPATAYPAGRGAAVPWIEHQAEDNPTNAQVIGPSRIKWDSNHIEAEAIGRKAVRLTQTGHYVSFHTTAAANSIVVRYSIPDAPGGGGIDKTLGLYVNGTRVKTLNLTSRYAWSYKGGLIGDPIVDKPAEQPHTFFDEVHVLLDSIPVGAEVKLQRDAQDDAAFYVIDLVDFEQVAPPKTMPAGFRSITEFGVQPNDGLNHAAEIQNALRATSKLWFPPGEYLATSISGGNVGLDNPGTEVRGAGEWYTTLRGPKALFFCIGANTKCVYGDFAVFGEAKARAEETQGVQKAFAGPLGNGSLLEHLWIEHEVGAIWVGNDPPYQDAPTQNLTIRNCRIRNTYADGINLDNGTSNSLVENVHFRNTGDDAAVVWSIKWTKWVKEMTYRFGDGYIKPEAKNAPDQGIGHGNTFRHITVQMPWRANCFASYGGYDNHFEDSICEDVLTYPGILIDNEFSSYPFSAPVTVYKNISLNRAGGTMFFETTARPWNHGALKLYMREGDVNDILVDNVEIMEPTFSGIEFRGFGHAYAPPGERVSEEYLTAADNAKYTNVTLRNIKITGAGTYGIEIVDNATRGQVTFDGVSVAGSVKGPLDQGGAPGSFFNRVNSNPGWEPTGGGPNDAGTPDSGQPDSGQPGGNLALNKPISESSHTQNYAATNAVDGNASTYWESANNAFPQTLTVDLGTARNVNKIVLKLPPPSAWGARTQTLSVLGSTDGSNYGTILSSRGVNFDPATGNTATLTFTTTSQRYIRLNFTGNTGWPAGQVSEFEVYGP